MLYKSATDKICMQYEQEENVMNDTCGCSFSDEEIRALSLLEESILTERGIEMIAILPKKELNTIIKIAALLPSPDEMKKILIENEKELSLGITKPFENLHDAIKTIRIALSQMIRGGLYKYQVDIIEALSIVIDKHTTEKRKYWEDELIEVLLRDEQLRKIKTWLGCSENIKKLVQSFNLPKEKIVEIFKEATEKDKELRNIVFWLNNSSGIKKLVEAFNLSEEGIKEALKELIDGRNKELVRVSDLFIKASISSKEELKKEAKDVFEELIYNEDEMFLSRHLTVAKKMNILISPEEYQAIADNLLKAANASTDTWIRRRMVKTVCYAYRDLREYDLKGRERIIKRYDDTKDDNRGINKVIRTASKVIGFKYEKQGFWDIHIGR